MMRRVPPTTLLAAAAVCLLAAATRNSSAQEPTIVVELIQDSVFVGETAQCRVLLNQFDGDASAEFPVSDDYTVREISRTVRNSVEIRSFNFKTQRIERKGPEIVYEITPRRAGKITISGPTATHDGLTLQGKSVVLRVRDVAEQDFVRLSITSDQEFVYPTQDFSVRLLVSVKGLPDPLQDRDPITVQRAVNRTYPTLTIPWADDDQLPSGITPRDPLNRWIGRFVANDSRGLSINGYRQRGSLLSNFFGRGGDDRLAFRPPPRRVMDADLRGRRTEYWQYTFERRFDAEEAGRYSFGPVTLKGEFGSAVLGRSLETEPVYAVAAPITVTVQEPPLNGKPPEFVGAIGRFECGASVTPTIAKVGDPMTLTLWLRGSGSLDQAVAPDLTTIPEIANAFKVYDATEETDQDVRRFTYSLRPKEAGTSEFPAVAMAYFDVDAGEYVTMKTDPVTIEVASTDRLQRNQISVAGTTAPNRTGEIEVSEAGIFANVTDLNAVRDERVRPDRWFLVLGSLASTFLVLVVGKQQVGRRAGDVGLQRRRKATTRALRRIDDARQVVTDSHATAAADQISGALVGFVADVVNIAEQGLTSSDAAAHMRETEAEPELVERFESLVQECDAIRYGSGSGSIETLITSADELVNDLSKNLRKTKRLP